MNIIKEETLYKNVEKQYTIIINGKEIKIHKWIKVDNFNENFEDYDNDWGLVEESTENYNQLTDEEKDELDDFIMEIEL